MYITLILSAKELHVNQAAASASLYCCLLVNGASLESPKEEKGHAHQDYDC